MEKKLNQLLANLVVEYHKLQNFHWYVKGADFFQVHAKLEEYYDGINGAIDDVAESILMIGGQPLASLKDFVAEASIQEASAQYRSSKEIMNEVVKDFELLLEQVKEIKAAADEEGNYLISGNMDGYISEFMKSLWMMRQQRA